MIVRMSKVEIVGPKNLLQDVICVLRELGIFQLEPVAIGFIERAEEADIRSFALDERATQERLFLEDLRGKIVELFSYLPKMPVRTSYLEPPSVVDTIAKTVEKHITVAKDLTERREGLKRERSELDRFRIFLGSVSSLIEDSVEAPYLDFIGLTIAEPSQVQRLREALSRITDWKYELVTKPADDGTLIGLLTIEKELSDRVKKSLSDERVPELAFPPSFTGLTFPGKIAFVKRRIAQVAGEIERIESDLGRFSHQWVPIYQSVRDWIQDRLSVLHATASAFETRYCFFINGWMPKREVGGLKEELREDFGGSVLVDEKEMRDEDLEHVPIVLKNPAYFKPFELLTRLLPLPAYTSYDPTPFIGIFFPVFFGIILGDAGYGLILCLASLIMMKRFKGTGAVRDGSKVLFVSSLYATFFGVLYGEFFGELPHKLFGLEPIFLDRRVAIIPMICFTVGIGIFHILLGLMLGTIGALRKKTRKEAAYHFLCIVTIIGLIVILGSLFGVFPALLTRPIMIGLLVLTPLLFFTGGVLAPLELLKSIGNIISYVRIMAIGLTSVLLAFVANHLAGLTGDVVTGVLVAGLLHLLNLVLGVFSPAIHSLRLHYVEFFSKFVEHGGRRFEPLRK